MIPDAQPAIDEVLHALEAARMLMGLNGPVEELRMLHAKLKKPSTKDHEGKIFDCTHMTWFQSVENRKFLFSFLDKLFSHVESNIKHQPDYDKDKAIAVLNYLLETLDQPLVEAIWPEGLLKVGTSWKEGDCKIDHYADYSHRLSEFREKHRELESAEFVPPKNKEAAPTKVPLDKLGEALKELNEKYYDFIHSTARVPLLLTVISKLNVGGGGWEVLKDAGAAEIIGNIFKGGLSRNNRYSDYNDSRVALAKMLRADEKTPEALKIAANKFYEYYKKTGEPIVNDQLDLPETQGTFGFDPPAKKRRGRSKSTPT